MRVFTLLPILLTFAMALGIAGTAQGAESVGAKFRKANPEYIRRVIPESPGSVKLSLPDGPSYKLGFLGTSNLLLRTSVLKTPSDVHFRSEPGAHYYFGIQFFQGAGFTWGLPRRYQIDANNRYTGKRQGENYGRIRVAAGTSEVQYEVATGTIKLDRFSVESDTPRGSFRTWRVHGSFIGTMARTELKRAADKTRFPESLQLTAELDCVLIEDRDPIPGGTGQVDIALEDFLVPKVSLRAGMRYSTNLRGKALEFNSIGVGTYNFVFQVRDPANVSWPPAGRYVLSEANVDPPEILTQDEYRRPLVFSFVYNPQEDVHLIYTPVRGYFAFEQAELISTNSDGLEYWRVKGSFGGTLLLKDNKIGTGPTWKLAIDPVVDHEEIRITRGTFDVLLSRPAQPDPAWKQKYPGINPNAAAEVPSR